MPTIRDIASLAQVSPATVSRVLNGGTAVSPEKEDRVRAAVARLGYRPAGPARNLRRGVADVWAVIIPDIENPFLTSLVRGVEDVAHRNGLSVVLCNSDDDRAKEADYVGIAVAERMAGVIIAVASATESDLSPLIDARVPVVQVLRRHARFKLDGIYVNDQGGAALATTHLIERGARRLACITGPADASTAIERLMGFRRAHEQAGLVVDDRLVAHADFRYDGGYEAAVALLRVDPMPDAMFVANNLMGVGALDACVDQGLTVPTDVAMACFDDVPWGRHLQPRLTFVSHPAYSVGRTAGERLLARSRDMDAPAASTFLEPDLHIAESSRHDLGREPSRGAPVPNGR